MRAPKPRPVISPKMKIECICVAFFCDKPQKNEIRDCKEVVSYKSGEIIKDHFVAFTKTPTPLSLGYQTSLSLSNWFTSPNAKSKYQGLFGAFVNLLSDAFVEFVKLPCASKRAT